MAKKEKQIEKIGVDYYIHHHQVVFDCPSCGHTIVDDLGEYPDATGLEYDCPECECEIELEEQIE